MVAQVLDKLGEDGLKLLQGHGRICLLFSFCVFGGLQLKTGVDDYLLYIYIIITAAGS